MKFIQQLEQQPAPEPRAPSMLADLNESALLRTVSQLHHINAKDVADFTFLYFLTLQVLREDFHAVPFTQAYANTTLRWGAHFDRFSSAGTDLYVLLHVCEGHSRESLGDTLASRAFFKNFHLTQHQVVWALRQLGYNQRSPSTETRFLIQLERELKVDSSNYKSCRRLIASWGTIDTADKRLVITRLLQAFRTRMPRSELLAPLQAMSDRHNMELKGATNAETGAMDKHAVLLRAAEMAASTGLDLPTCVSMVMKGMTK
jgi:hypothetical protein